MTWGSLGPKLDRFEFIYWYTGPCSPCSIRTSLLACSIAKYFWNARSKEKSAGFTFNISVIIFESRMPESNQSQSRLALIASTNLHSWPSASRWQQWLTALPEFPVDYLATYADLSGLSRFCICCTMTACVMASSLSYAEATESFATW